MKIQWSQIRRRGLLGAVFGAAVMFGFSAVVVGQSPRYADDANVTVRVSPNATDRATEAMREVADRIDAAGVQLSILSGSGGTVAARDLLFRRGVEFAVLRSDLLAFLRQSGELPEAAQRLRYVTHLYTDKIYLWGRQGIDRVADLNGKTLAIVAGDSDARVTAETLLGLADVSAEIVDFAPLPPSGTAVSGEAPRAADAVLLVGAQMQPPLADWARGNGLALVPLPLTSELGNAFVSAKIDQADGRGTAVPTLGVAAFLGTFNWNVQGERFPKVRRFITSFYRSLTDLRAAHPDSIWMESDIALRPGEWRRFDPAAPSRTIDREDRRALSNVSPPRSYLAHSRRDHDVRTGPMAGRVEARGDRAVRAALPPQGATRAPAVTSATQREVTVAVIRRPPFADDKSTDGNVTLEILRESLQGETADGRAPPRLKLIWTDRGDVLDPSKSQVATAMISFPWQRPHCDSPGELTRAAAFLCDQAVFSEPVMRVVAGVYVDAARRKKLEDIRASGPQRLKITVCVPDDAETASLPKSKLPDAGGQPIEITAIKKQSLVHCIAAVQTAEADGFLATDLEARQLTAKLGLSGIFEIYEPTLFTDSLHVAAPRQSAEGVALIAEIDAGLVRLKNNGAYAKLMQRYVVAAWKANR